MPRGRRQQLAYRYGLVAVGAGAKTGEMRFHGIIDAADESFTQCDAHQRRYYAARCRPQLVLRVAVVLIKIFFYDQLAVSRNQNTMYVGIGAVYHFINHFPDTIFVEPRGPDTADVDPVI